MITTISVLYDSQSLISAIIVFDLVPMSYAFVHAPAAISPSSK